MEENLIRVRHKSGETQEISHKLLQAGDQLVRRTCDYCGESMDLTQKPLTPEDAALVASWVILVRVFLVDGHSYPVQKHACRDSCARNIVELDMLSLPKEILEKIAEEKRLAEEFKKKQASMSSEAGGEIPAVLQPTGQA